MKHSSYPDIEKISHILSGKWTPLIIAKLCDDPMRFSEIERAIPDINPRTLSKRLDDLKASGVITNCQNDPDYSDLCYRLTDEGRDLQPILREMSKWGQKHPRHTTDNIA